jgi:hypothetical protein
MNKIGFIFPALVQQIGVSHTHTCLGMRVGGGTVDQFLCLSFSLSYLSFLIKSVKMGGEQASSAAVL